MEVVVSGGGSGGGGGAGPAPFLIKTYEMVDDSSTDEIVSWSSNNNSFVVWNPPEFARILLPTYFKHNNFSSFIRQLNTYGFRKIDPERWEFANEEFIKDQKHLLKNIHRRKPIHSHSQPPQGSLAESEKAVLDEEIERLSREKTAIQTDLWRYNQQDPELKLQLEDLERKVQEMEVRQSRMMSFLTRAVHNPSFVEQMSRMAGSSMYFSAINKKRRIPKGDYVEGVGAETCSAENSGGNIIKRDFGHAFHQDYSNKLTLELSPAVSESNLLSSSVQSSNEDGASSQKKMSDEVVKDASPRTEGLLFVPETLELADTGTSFSLRKDSLLLGQVRGNDLSSIEEGDGHISCHLNLTLASSLLQEHNSRCAVAKPTQLNLPDESRPSVSGDVGVVGKNRKIADDDATMSSSQEAAVNNSGHAAAPRRVNDLFWEQFLTERPGSSDTEEASSSLKANSSDDQEERTPGGSGTGKSWRNRKDMEQLTL